MAIKKLGATINPKLRLVVLTGAGIFIESGVPIFTVRGRYRRFQRRRGLPVKQDGLGAPGKLGNSMSGEGNL